MRHRIAVVGAGPGGLTFARVLQRHGHEVVVLERDAGPDARPQGGALDLHAGLGQVAVEKAGLLERFHELSRPEGQAMRILATDGTVLRDWRPAPDERANPEIDRAQLRDLLLGSMEVRWGCEVRCVEPGTPEGTLVHLADGRREPYDLVIGADGAWSKVRHAVSDVTPSYTGVTAVETALDDVDRRHPDLAALVGDGAVAVYGVNRSIVAQRNSGGHVKIYAQFRAPADAVVDVPGLFEGWAEPVLDLLRRGTGAVRRPLYVLPAGHAWAHVPGVTLLGDAAHLMPPLGVGANLAMLEGAELAEALADADELDAAVLAFEERMRQRAARWARMTIDGLERLVSPDPEEAIAYLDRFHPKS